MDLSIYKVDLDTDQPNGGKGESPRSAFTKYNNSLDVINGELTTLGTAATRNVGTSDGNVILQGNYGANIQRAQGDFASLSSVPSSPDAWNSLNKSSLRLQNDNNALVVFVSAKNNERVASIQSGHVSTGFAHVLGTLHLNPMGGEVTVNGSAIFESGTNSNGNYTKFADGTLICTTLRTPLTNDSGNSSTASVEFPATFASTNYVLSTELVGSFTQSIRAGEFWVGGRSSTGASVLWLTADSQTSANISPLRVSCIIIGRWK